MAEICQMLDWDSRFFDLRIARVNGARLEGARVQAVLDWCRRNQVDCLYYLADADDAASIRWAEQTGFSCVDIRVTLQRSLAGYTPGESLASRLSVRTWQESDLPALQRIAASAFGSTRFYADPGFARQQVDALYQTWITKSCFGYAQYVGVAVSPSNSSPCGFITASLELTTQAESAKSPKRGSLGLLGIEASARRQGTGQVMVLAALDWLAAQQVELVSVVTQGRNIAAQRLYQRCGFLTHAMQLWYHLWFR